MKLKTQYNPVVGIGSLTTTLLNPLDQLLKDFVNKYMNNPQLIVEYCTKIEDRSIWSSQCQIKSDVDIPSSKTLEFSQLILSEYTPLSDWDIPIIYKQLELTLDLCNSHDFNSVIGFQIKAHIPSFDLKSLRPLVFVELFITVC